MVRHVVVGMLGGPTALPAPASLATSPPPSFPPYPQSQAAGLAGALSEPPPSRPPCLLPPTPRSPLLLAQLDVSAEQLLKQQALLQKVRNGGRVAVMGWWGGTTGGEERGACHPLHPAPPTPLCHPISTPPPPLNRCSSTTCCPAAVPAADLDDGKEYATLLTADLPAAPKAPMFTLDHKKAANESKPEDGKLAIDKVKVRHGWWLSGGGAWCVARPPTSLVPAPCPSLHPPTRR